MGAWQQNVKTVRLVGACCEIYLSPDKYFLRVSYQDITFFTEENKLWVLLNK